MKKLTLIFLGFLIGLSNIHAQKVDLRAYFGFNVLQLTSDEGTRLIDGVVHDQSVSGRVGYQMGGALTFGERFYIQPGFQYTVLSTKIINENTQTGDELTDETTLNVISVPLKFGFRLINPEVEDMINVRIFAGFDGHHVTSVNHGKKSKALDDIEADDYSNLIMNADFGMGLDVLFLFLDLGYQLGLSPVHSGGDSAKSNAFYSNLGLRIKF